MKECTDRLHIPTPPLNGPAVKMLEDALLCSRTKTIHVEINQSIYELAREGRWFRFSLLTKKRTIKKSALFETLTELYNQAVHGNSWHIAESSGI